MQQHRVCVRQQQQQWSGGEPDRAELHKLLSSSPLLARQYAWRRYGGADSTIRDQLQTVHHAEAGKRQRKQRPPGAIR